MDEINDRSSDRVENSFDTTKGSSHFAINGVYPNGTFSFYTQNPESKIPNNQELIEDEDTRERRKLARQSYYENHRDFSQRHFEQSCAVDKQLLWLSGAAIGLSVAYLGQIGSIVASYITFIILVLAWVALLASMFLIIKSMDFG